MRQPGMPRRCGVIEQLSPEQAYIASYGSKPTLPIQYEAKADRLIFHTPSGLEIVVPLHFPDRVTEPRDINLPRSGSPLVHTIGGYCELFQRPAMMAWNPATQDMVPVWCSPLMWFFGRETAGGGTGSTGYASRVEAELGLVSNIWTHIEFIESKVTWMRNGDKVPPRGRGFHRVPEAQVIRCGARHYTIGPEPSDAEWRNSRSMLGFGGAKFRFRLLATGEIIESRNVWSQGEIPVEYRGLLIDNAEAVRGE